MTDELDTLHPPKSHDLDKARFADYLREFLADPLVPTLQRMRMEDSAEYNRRLDEQRGFYEAEQRHQFELIKGMDAQNRDTYRNMHDIAQELRDETKDSRAAKEQLTRVTMGLERATEDIVDKNKQQDETIDDLKARITSMEHDMQMLQRHDQTMLEVLMGGGAVPGAINDIRDLRERQDRMSELIASSFAAINTKLDDLGKPRGLSVIVDWFKRNPAALLVLGFGLSLVIHL